MEETKKILIQELKSCRFFKSKSCISEKELEKESLENLKIIRKFITQHN